MLFQLSEQNFPHALNIPIIPEEYAHFKLANHDAQVTIATDCCTLIRQTLDKTKYSIWVNDFIIYRPDPLVLYVLPNEQLHSLYYSLVNNAELRLSSEEIHIPEHTFQILDLEPAYHFGVFKPGTYKSLHLTTNEDNKWILEDQEYTTTLLQAYFHDTF